VANTMAVEPNQSESASSRCLRIIERTELPNPTSGFIAYVPREAWKRESCGTTGGNGTTMQCTMCHGANLQGMGNVPSDCGPLACQMGAANH